RYDQFSYDRRLATDSSTWNRIVALNAEAAWVDEDGRHLVEVIVLQTEDQQTGPGGDGDLDLVVDLLPAAALPVLLRNEDAQRVAQPRLLEFRQPAIVANVRFEVAQPFGRKRLGQQLIAAPALEPGEDHADSTATCWRWRSCSSLYAAPACVEALSCLRCHPVALASHWRICFMFAARLGLLALSVVACSATATRAGEKKLFRAGAFAQDVTPTKLPI